MDKSLTNTSSLEEIELSQPFSERVIIPIVRKVGEISARFTPQKAIQDTARKMGRHMPVHFLLIHILNL
jgi:hypothetical protein